jgi:hypothetical protein
MEPEVEAQVCTICWEELNSTELLYAKATGGDLVCTACQSELNEDDVENYGHE